MSDDAFAILSVHPRGLGRTVQELFKVVHRCTYPGFTFKCAIEGGVRPYIQIACSGTDTATGEPMDWTGRKWMLSGWMTDTEIVHTCWAAVQRAILHEASELFRFDDASIFDRHLSVHHLVELAGRSDALDARDSPHA
jgi:hypothetical protein